MLPFLFSLGLPALAPTLGITGMSGAALAGLGAGLGSFMETGDVGKGIKTGLLSFLGGKVLGGLGGGVAGLQNSTSQAALTGQAQAAMAQPQFLEAVANQGIQAPMSGMIGNQAASAILQPGVMTAANIGSAVGSMDQGDGREDEDDDKFIPPMPNPPKRTATFGDPLASSKEMNYFDYTFTPQPDLEDPYIDYGTAQQNYRNRGQVQRRRGGGLMSLNRNPIMGLQQGLMAALNDNARSKIGPFIEKVEQDARAEFGDEIFQPQPMQPQHIAHALFAGARPQPEHARVPTLMHRAELQAEPEFLMGFGGGGRNPNYTGPKTVAPSLSESMAQAGKGGGLSPARNIFQSALGFAEGGEVESMNEKDIILESIMAIKGMKGEAEAQMVLGAFLKEYGEEALRDLVESVQSGEYDDTVARFAEGEKGMVRGPSDGSGEDDKVPATLDNQQDVLLTEGEFVIRKPTTDALTKAYGGGFLDKINEAEEDAPKVLEKMVG